MTGEGDGRFHSYCYRLILTENPGSRIEITSSTRIRFSELRVAAALYPEQSPWNPNGHLSWQMIPASGMNLELSWNAAAGNGELQQKGGGTRPYRVVRWQQMG